jgi:hypothetical protein
MQNLLLVKCSLAVAAVGMLFQAGASAQQKSPYVVSANGQSVHILPPPSIAEGLRPPVGALTYHGGPIMPTVTLYAIYWVPAHLQNGNPTTLSAKYQSVTKNFLTDYNGHGIANNSTQYSQVKSGVTSYFKDSGTFAASYLDTNPYPASGCTDGVTGTNCISDGQLQAEITRVMALKGWTAGMNKMYLVFTSTGEGSCFSDGVTCAYTNYCAYHGYYGNATNPVIYGNEPYGDPNYCAGSISSPNGDLPSDVAANIASHEVTEANTDPELNAWWDSANGEEIGDLCAYQFGSNTWDSGLANQMWNGHFYDLQMEYDNHTSSCVQVGP